LGYFLILPFLWSDIIGRWAFPERAAMCVALFGSGFVTLLGGLSAGHPGFGLIERARLDNAGAAIRPLPVEARFAAYPTFNQPVLLQGRKAVLGYPGHLWTEGFNNTEANNRLTALMNGAANWREAAERVARPLYLLGPGRKDELPIKQPSLGSHVFSCGVRRLGRNLRSGFGSPSALRRNAWFAVRRMFHRRAELPA